MTDVTLPSGIAKDELDAEVRPQDDLFRHVNGRWIERTEIPADKARYGSFLVLHEEAEQAVREIIEEAQEAEPGTEARKVGDLYASFMNEQRADLLGATPIAGQLVDVSLIGSVESFLETLGRLERQGVSGFLQLYVDNDPGDPERYLVFVEQGGIGLPDESYFREERFEGVRTAYNAHLERMFGLAQLEDPADRAVRVFDLETDLAKVHWNNVDTRDSEKTYNLFTVGGCRGRGIRRPAGVARRHGRARGRVRRARAARAVVRRGTRRAAHRGAPAGVEGLARLAGDPLERGLPVERLRRGELRLLRPHAHRHPADARAVEARRLARRGRDGRGRGPHLRRAALPAGREGGHGRPRRQPRRGVPAVDHGARLDGQEDPHARARQARRSSRRRSASP